MAATTRTSTGWTGADIPDLSGRTAIVTGANSGLGFVTAAALAAHGASVTLAARDPARGEAAAERLRSTVPDAAVQVRALDLASLASVRTFAKTWAEQNPAGLDLLVNNAGVMNIPQRFTADGFEMQLGTNHLGHFALTGLLLPALLARPDPRVVTVSSLVHRRGMMKFDDLMGEARYRPWAAYGQSKLANLLFTSELQRLANACGRMLLSAAAHPGYADTNLQGVGADMRGSAFERKLTALANRLLAQPAEMGALPSLYAATAPGLTGDSFVGPDGRGQQRGHPRLVARSARARNATDARRLWQVSESLTGVRFDFD